MFKKTAIIAGMGLALSATAQADYRWQLDAGVVWCRTSREWDRELGQRSLYSADSHRLLRGGALISPPSAPAAAAGGGRSCSEAHPPRRCVIGDVGGMGRRWQGKCHTGESRTGLKGLAVRRNSRVAVNGKTLPETGKRFPLLCAAQRNCPLATP